MRVGKYELGKTLGEGNFGKVKLAVDLRSGRRYAVKILDKTKILHLNFSDQVWFHFLSSFYFSSYCCYSANRTDAIGIDCRLSVK